MGDTSGDQDDRATVEAAGVSSFPELPMFSDGVYSSSNHHREDNVGEEGFVFSGKYGSRMLCFNGDYQNDDESLFIEPSYFPSSEASIPDSSCINSTCKNSNNTCTVEKSTKSSNKKKRTGSGNEQNPDHNPKPGKKYKRNQEKSSVGTAKVKKERLGERIAALQQLVSPYGKTDAASVLHEAMGYIKFLQDQIQVLSSPYLINHSLDGGVVAGNVIPVKKVRDLRSRGLCLVPISSTVHVENSNGADFWSPAAASVPMAHTHTTLPSMNQGY